MKLEFLVDTHDVTSNHLFCPDTRTVVDGVCTACGMNDDGARQFVAGQTHFFINDVEVDEPRYKEAYRQLLAEAGEPTPDWLLGS